MKKKTKRKILASLITIVIFTLPALVIYWDKINYLDGLKIICLLIILLPLIGIYMVVEAALEGGCSNNLRGPG